MKLLIGSVINQRFSVFMQFLTSLKELNKKNFDVDFYFIDSGLDKDVSTALCKLTKTSKKMQVTAMNADIAEKKNAIVQYAKEHQFDYLFLINSDLVLSQETLQHLVLQDKDVISEIFYTNMKSGESLPVRYVNDYNQANGGLNKNDMIRYLRKLKTADDLESNVVGDCTLFSKKSLQLGVSFARLGDRNTIIKDFGEVCNGHVSSEVKSYVDTRMPAYHINKIEDIYHISEFKKVNKAKKPTKVEKSDKIEIAFLPYKASMWDSLESIWLAAIADPKCEAYVIPIPYYDKLADGTFGQEHYEGELYPDDVPITDYRDYNMEERRPDIIFIHNPYDDRNTITSVHPNYYSFRLKDYTKLLCYSPYWVGGHDIQEHFCNTRGVLNSDRIFVQTDIVRNTYLRVLEETEKKYNCVGKFGILEEKIVVSGSPKFDKVINLKSEELILPDNWKRLIENEDGSTKKIVLYNTSIGGILERTEQYLKKLRSVIDMFHKRNDIVFWWRPHPLSEETFASMRPQFLEEYREIITKYKSEGWGIYDDTIDLHRAIKLSSYLYSDLGSLVFMFQITGKPVMMQNIDVLYTDDLNKNRSYNDIVHDLKTLDDIAYKETPQFNVMEWIDKIETNTLHSYKYKEQIKFCKRKIKNLDGSSGNFIYNYCKSEIKK